MILAPYVLAIFVTCSPDLLYCSYTENLTKTFKIDTDACREYVAETVVERFNAVILGKCVWRIPK